MATATLLDSEVELSLTRLNVTDVHSNKEANHSFGLERVAHLTLAHSRTILKLLANQITYGTLNQKMCVWSARDNNLGKIMEATGYYEEVGCQTCTSLVSFVPR